VVCALGETIASFWPRRRFRSVDFPTLGRPTRLMKPARWTGAASGNDVERGGGSGIELPEEGHLARVHESSLPDVAVVVADQVEARVAGQEIELLGEGMPQRAGLAVGALHGQDRLAEHGGGAVEGKGQDVGALPDSPIPRIEPADRAIIDQGHRQLMIPGAEVTQDHPERPPEPRVVDGPVLMVPEGDHVRPRPVARVHSS